ncbi:hypothetical protein LOTGIDRAFT_236792 [Lottia gigantea]|uniref:DUF4590 domain-containing protein n=1 Tax=Lottia gigantea TaxID=225164 RepID=V3ZGC4_LOTGI|nr:hypothetical protein LOTGIDRAFT_236792 [Lottia gigantea]ESO83207.1 hypothetical protein LOTGIDRAFT_236792 [Lottia gigantea]
MSKIKNQDRTCYREKFHNGIVMSNVIMCFYSMSTQALDNTVHHGTIYVYNSLTDGHLAGFYASPRKRRHLRKVGLISRSGHLISENTFRLNMAKKDRRRHIKNTLAQAIVEKTLELDRHRQNVIKQKLEEIAKIELVQRVRTSETELRKRNQEMLPYLSPQSPRRPTSGPAPNKTGGSTHGKYRPISAPLNTRPASSSTKTSTNYDDYDDEGDVEYIDVNGESSSPRQNSYRDDHTLDLNQLYTLNTVALRKYAMTLARLEKGQNGTSPYTTASTVPMPPRSPRNVTSARRRKYNSGANSDRSPQRTSAAYKNHLHQADTVTIHPGQLQSMVEVSMKYHGWNLSLARDEIDPRNLVVIEQQHCGGNTLTVFKQKLHPGSEFTFVSHRHRGYPFSLTIYVDGRMDSRVSTCCEYRHARNVRLGGANGHFSIVDVKGNTPCFKCRVERGGKKKKKKRSKPEPMVEEIVVKKSVNGTIKEDKNSDTESEDTGNYEDDFENSDNEQKQNGGQNEDEDYTYINPSAKERGDDWKTEVEENNQTSDNESDGGRKTDDDDPSTQKNKDESEVTSSKSEVKVKTKKKKKKKEGKIKRKKKADSSRSDEDSSHAGKSDTTKSSSKSTDASKSSKASSKSSGSESSSSKSSSHEEEEDKYSTDEEESSDTEVNTADEVSDIETEAESPRRLIADAKEPASQRKVTFREEVSFASDVVERSESLDVNPNLLTPLSPSRRSGVQEDIYSSRENLYMPELDDVPNSSELIESNAESMEVSDKPSAVAVDIGTHEQLDKEQASSAIEEQMKPNPEPPSLQSSASLDLKKEKRVTSKPPKPRSKIKHQASIQVFVEDEESPIVSPHSDLRGEDQEQSRSEEAGLVPKEQLSDGQPQNSDGPPSPQERLQSPHGTSQSTVGTLPQTDDNSHTITSDQTPVRNEDPIDREVDREIDKLLQLCMEEAKDLVGNHNKLITEGPDNSKDYMINEADYSDEYCNRISQQDKEQRKTAKKEKSLLSPSEAPEISKQSEKPDGLLKSSLKVENSPRKHVMKTVSFDTKVDIEPNSAEPDPPGSDPSGLVTPEPVQNSADDEAPAGISTNSTVPTVVIEVDSKPISDSEESSSDSSSDSSDTESSDSEVTETNSKNTEDKRSDIIDSTMTNYSFDK